MEIYQNCIIFNDKTFDSITGRDNRDDRMVYLEHGKPLIFGKKKEKGIKIKRLQPKVIQINDLKPNEELLVHNEQDPTQMEFPEVPVPFGVFRDIERPTYDEMMDKQVQDETKKRGKGNLKELIYGTETWTVG